MKRIFSLIAVVGLLAGFAGPAVAESQHHQHKCPVEGADIVDGGALYDQATATLQFRMTTGGASCSWLRYRIAVYDDDNPASRPLAVTRVRGDDAAQNPDGTDFVFFTFTNIPAGDFIFCFVGNNGSEDLVDRAPDAGRFCFDTSGGGSGGNRFR